MDKRKELGQTLEELKGWGGLTADLLVARFVTQDAARRAFNTLSQRAREAVRTGRGVAVACGSLMHDGSSFNVAGIICPELDTNTHMRWLGDTTVEGLQEAGLLKLGDQNRDQFGSATSPLTVHEFVVVQPEAAVGRSAVAGSAAHATAAAASVPEQRAAPPAPPQSCGKCGQLLQTEPAVGDSSIEQLMASPLYCARCDDILCVKCGASLMGDPGAVPCGKCGAPAVTLTEGAHPSWYPGDRPGLSVSVRDTSVATPILDEFSDDLTETCAREGTSRADDVARLVHALCRQRRRPVAFVGEANVARKFIIDAFAARLRDRDVPPILQGKRLLSIDLLALAGRSDSRKHIVERVRTALLEADQCGDVILLFDHSSTFLSWAPLRRVLLGVGNDYAASFVIVLVGDGTAWKRVGADWFGCEHPTVFEVSPPSAEEAVVYLTAIKGELETFHALTYPDEAITAAVRCAGINSIETGLIDGAEALLDQAGASVKRRSMSRAPELSAVQASIRRIREELKDAIGAHDFDRARTMSDEERAQREILRQLEGKASQSARGVVTAEEVERAYIAGKAGHSDV